MFRILSLIAALGVASPLTAQEIMDCGGWQDSVRAIPDPVADHVAYFSNGEIRVVLLDTVEPAAGAFYLMILTPPRDEMGNRVCALVGHRGMGLAGLDWPQLGASYDPSIGLTLRLPATLFAPNTGGFDPAILAVDINQATGAITPRFEIP